MCQSQCKSQQSGIVLCTDRESLQTVGSVSHSVNYSSQKSFCALAGKVCGGLDVSVIL